jgi:hypothetical protein
MANALFDFSGDGEDRGFEGLNGVTYALRLRQQPPIGVDSVLFQVWNEAGADPSLGIAANPPRASKNAPALTLEGASSGAAVSPATLDGTVSITAPVGGGHSYIVRCVVNRGKRTLPNGSEVLDPTLIHERGFFVRTALGSRKIVCTERQEFEVEGFAGALSDMMESDAGAEGGGGVTLPDGEYEYEPLAWHGEGGWHGSNQITVKFLVAPAPDNTLVIMANAQELLACDATGLGFFGATPVAPPSITGATAQDQIDSLVAALAALGLVTDAR